jgi:hypothetical protein
LRSGNGWLGVVSASSTSVSAPYTTGLLLGVDLLLVGGRGTHTAFLG